MIPNNCIGQEGHIPCNVMEFCLITGSPLVLIKLTCNAQVLLNYNLKNGNKNTTKKCYLPPGLLERDQ